jgi:excisionase family DNA binding protein
MTTKTEGTRAQNIKQGAVDMPLNSANSANSAEIEGEDSFLETNEACAYLRVSRGWLYGHKELFTYYKVGERYRFCKSDLKAYLEKSRHQPVEPRGTIDKVLPSA